MASTGARHTAGGGSASRFFFKSKKFEVQACGEIDHQYKLIGMVINGPIWTTERTGGVPGPLQLRCCIVLMTQAARRSPRRPITVLRADLTDSGSTSAQTDSIIGRRPKGLYDL